MKIFMHRATNALQANAFTQQKIKRVTGSNKTTATVLLPSPNVGIALLPYIEKATNRIDERVLKKNDMKTTYKSTDKVTSFSERP